MNELSKVRKVVGKAVPGAPHEVLLVLDGTTGQNALSQGKVFGEVAGVTGVVVTKLDGTARGGVVIAINGELGLPVKFIGIGEQVDDLRPFDANSYVDALLADG
jgi:fused signal recognition particle receptor